MKTATYLAALSGVGLAAANPLLQERARCNADNCARAVTGTRPVLALSSRLADCSSFQQVTVTPAVSTATVISVIGLTTTSIFKGDGNLDKRQITIVPSAVPAYASACSGSVRYASACSCAGITQVTITAVASTTTVTQTTTVPVATQTITPGERPVCGSTVLGGGGCGCPYLVECNRKFEGGELISSPKFLSELGCLAACDSFTDCSDADYSRSTGVCNLYVRTTSSVEVLGDDAFSYTQGQCEALNVGANCTIGLQ